MEEKRKKLPFVFVFFTYLPLFLLKFRLGELVGCRIWFCIQRVPTMHTFDGPCYPKNKKYLKNVMMMLSSCFFRYFLFLGWRGLSKVCSVGNHWMWNQILHPMSSPGWNLSKNTGRYVENTNTKSSFFISFSKINQYYFNYYFIILTIILLFSLGGPF